MTVNAQGHHGVYLVLMKFMPTTGGDDRRVLLWHMEKAIHARSKPVKLKGEHLSNIFCLAFDSTNKKVFSGGMSTKNPISVAISLALIYTYALVYR